MFRLIYYTFLGLLMGGICFEVGLHGYTARENAGYIFFSIIFLFLGSMVASARRSKFLKKKEYKVLPDIQSESIESYGLHLR